MEEIQDNNIHKNLYNKTREYDIRGIMIPCIGDILYYDTVDMQAIIQEVNDDRYINPRFLPIGVIADISTDLKTIKLITPYLIKISLDMNERISEKNIMKELKSFVRAYTKDLFKEDIEDMKFNMTTTADLQLLINNSDAVLQGIDYFNKLNVPEKLDIRELISDGILIYDNKGNIKFTYGLKDNFHMEYDKKDNDTAWNNVKTLKDFKETNIEILDCYIIPIATIKLD